MMIRKRKIKREEKDKTISELRNKIEEMEQKLKERDELLQRGEKRPRETTQVLPDINITVGTSSSRFQRTLCQIDVQGPRRERPKSYPHFIDEDNIVGIEEDVQQLVQQLINTQSRTFMAIVGMGGSGKTTLAKKIYSHQKIIRYFDCRAWICVSQVWSVESIVKDIFSQMTHQNSNNLTVTEMIQKINELFGDKSYIIVLDDVWEADILTKIIMPTAKSHRSKYVITTRNHNIISFPDLKFSVHEPRRLTDDQSLELFKKIAFDDQSNDPYVKLAKEMLRKCDGLPLAVISLAGLLRRKKTIQEWIKVRDNVSSKIIEDHFGPSDYGRVEDILGLSYSDLNHTLKSCFMYLSLFPEDDDIPCEVIMNCWIAEGIFKSIWLKSKETVEDLAREYLNELIQRCLVQIIRVNYAEIVKTIRLHDLLRDLALKRAKEKYFFDTLPSNSSPTSPMQVLLVIRLDELIKERFVI